MDSVSHEIPQPSMSDALSGVRVIDFTRHMAGPLAAQVLGDFGAEVIKVESAPHGDPLRSVGTSVINGVNSVFLLCNRNKKSIGINLRSGEGIEVVRRLVATADVLVENYRPEVMESMGLAYEELRKVNPRLLYCAANAFGSTGPLASQRGMDPVLQAFSGIMSVTGEADRSPVLVGVPVVDYSTGMLLVQSVLLGLLARERTGCGQRIEVSMLGTAISMLTTRLAAYWASGVDPRRFGSAHSLTVPYKAFKTADGFALAGVWQEEQWPSFCDIIEMPELKDDERFQRKTDRAKNREALEGILDPIFEKRTTAEWESRFRAAKGLFGAVQTFSEMFAHPQVEALDLVETVTHPEAGEVRQIAPVIQMSRTPGRVRSAPPSFGEHTRETLQSLKYTSAEIARLVADQVVFAADND